MQEFIVCIFWMWKRPSNVVDLKKYFYFYFLFIYYLLIISQRYHRLISKPERNRHLMAGGNYEWISANSIGGMNLVYFCKTFNLIWFHLNRGHPSPYLE
jgi:hypothetical protein